MAFRRVVPLFDRVLVQRIKPINKAVGGIVLPESAQPKNNEAKVISVGRGIRNSNGVFTPPLVEAGDLVLLPQFRGDEVNINNEDYLLVREEDILAKLEVEKK
eukprot:TRINITY_DN304_c1_g2_i1.p1 TRINITY_DN304_c1_g2~~TRINITY_DN304_c1_g2_i1.p1  ORF type:complete len:103 (+),score=16.33 TRINITY_DN304_c1_g2_i1:80-388(+)